MEGKKPQNWMGHIFGTPCVTASGKNLSSTFSSETNVVKQFWNIFNTSECTYHHRCFLRFNCLLNMTNIIFQCFDFLFGLKMKNANGWTSIEIESYKLWKNAATLITLCKCLGTCYKLLFATVHSRKFITNPTHWKTYISLLPFQLVPGLFCFVNSFPVTEFSGLTLSLEIVCRFLNGGKNCFPQPLGCLHLRLSPQLVVVGELVPGLGSHATLHGSGGVWMEANVGGIVVQFEAFTVDIKCDVFVRQIAVQLLTSFLQ